MGWPPSWATPEMVASAEASQARMDADADKLVDLARLIAGDDERLLGQLSRALTKAYFLGMRAEWDDRGRGARLCGVGLPLTNGGALHCLQAHGHTGQHYAAGTRWD